MVNLILDVTRTVSVDGSNVSMMPYAIGAKDKNLFMKLVVAAAKLRCRSFSEMNISRSDCCTGMG